MNLRLVQNIKFNPIKFPLIISSYCLQKQQNEYYLDMMKQLLDTPYLYFSYTYDLTHSLQRLNSMSPEFLQLGLLERADTRFVWNGFLLKSFQKPHFRQYSLPLILGCEY
jgi:phosphatidylinositol 4-phosphatase